jgi:hypothetical protein
MQSTNYIAISEIIWLLQNFLRKKIKGDSQIKKKTSKIYQAMAAHRLYLDLNSNKQTSQIQLHVIKK